MIAVIADDFTGAAEIAGLGLRQQLSVELCTTVRDSKADLLVVSSDSRSMNEADAVTVTKQIVDALLKLKPSMIFKKIDSVLRGHVLPEIYTQLTAMNLDTAVIVPANPSLERTISDGTYFYKKQPIHLSSFANDPEFGIKSSFVQEMVKGEVNIRKSKQSIDEKGIFVGEVEDNEDVNWWASQINKNILPVGGGDFFEALISKNDRAVNLLHQTNADKRILFVCCTTFKKSVESVARIKAAKGPVSYMPAELIDSLEENISLIDEWAKEIVQLLSTNKQIIIATDAATIKGGVSALSLRTKMAAVVKCIIQETMVEEIFVEGGSTAAAILQQLNWTHFFPVAELCRGVVKMKVAGNQDIQLTVKPGSYDWPPGIWNFEQTNN